MSVWQGLGLRLAASYVTALSIFLLASWAAVAQPGNSAGLDALLQREIVVGTKEAAPFAMKGPDGQWTGISIDLWRRIAEQKAIRYRFHEEETVPELIDAVVSYLPDRTATETKAVEVEDDDDTPEWSPL